MRQELKILKIVFILFLISLYDIKKYAKLGVVMKKDDRQTGSDFKLKTIRKDPKYFQGLEYKDTSTEEQVEAKLNRRVNVKDLPQDKEDSFLSLPIGANGK